MYPIGILSNCQYNYFWAARARYNNIMEVGIIYIPLAIQGTNQYKENASEYIMVIDFRREPLNRNTVRTK